MKKACILILFLLLGAVLSCVSIPSAKAQSQAEISPNHSGYLDNTTIPTTYHVVGEISNAGAVSLESPNVTASFYTEDNLFIGSSSSYAFLNVLLPNRKAPFEVVYVGVSASQIHNYSLSLESSEYAGERPITLQTLQNTAYTDEVGFTKVNGTIRNLATSNATAVRVIATFYDSEGIILGIASGYTIPSTIIPDQAENFEIELPRKIDSFSDYSITSESTEFEAIGTQVTINYGAAYTKTTSVTLILSSNDLQSEITQMRFSNNNVTFSDWELYVNLESWALLEGDGAKTVYAQFANSTGSISPVYFDTIILDTTLPTLTISSPINGSEIGSSSAAVTWVGVDATSGIFEYEIKMDNASWVNVQTNTTQTFTGLTDGQHIISVKARDRARLSTQESVSFAVTSNVFGMLGLGGIIAALILTPALIVVILVFRRIRKRKRKVRSSSN